MDRLQEIKSRLEEIDSRERELIQEARQLLRRLEDSRFQQASEAAEANREAGDRESYRRWAEEALSLDLERRRKRPSSPALNRSLAKTYLLLGEDDLAASHSDRALELALAKVARYPGSSSAAYSLALSYKLFDLRGKLFMSRILLLNHCF